MLQRAYSYMDKVKEYVLDLRNETRLMYYFSASRPNFDEECELDEWQAIRRVSLDPSSKPIGFLVATTDRDSNTISCLEVFSMIEEPNPILARDMLLFIAYLLDTGFRKISFSVHIGNDAEKQYDKAIKKFNGRVVGLKKKHCKLLDGKYYDLKLYEIMNKHQ